MYQSGLQLELTRREKIPIVLVDEQDRKMFIYQEEGLPSQFYASPNVHHHTLSSTSVEREDIQQAKQDPRYADNKSVFEDSQSASASVSANMHRIVEGVERLVESDTCEGAPAVPELPAFLRDPPTSSDPPFETDPSSLMFRQDGSNMLRPPIAPPGLGPRNAHPPASAVPAPSSFTPRPTLPSIPSIWNTAFAPQPGEAPSPQPRPATARQISPPGLSQQTTLSMASGTSPSLPSQEPTANDFAFRNGLLLQQQQQSSLDAPRSSPFESSWTPPNSAVLHRHSVAASAWDRDPLRGGHYYDAYLHQQHISSSLGDASWANNAFIASSLPSGATYPSSGGFTSSRKSAAQLGAIGQTPPCGQGG